MLDCYVDLSFLRIEYYRPLYVPQCSVEHSLLAGEGVSGPCVGVAGGVAAAPQPGMGIFAMMASLGTMPLPGTAGPEQQQPHPAGTTGRQGALHLTKLSRTF